MRPRLGGRGRDGPTLGTTPAIPPSFNEAPARWPGKRAVIIPKAANRIIRFNEAPARWPGKSATAHVGVPVAFSALQ